MKILLAGDSTVANCPAYEYPMSGWGAHLAPEVYSWGAVHNFAKGGATTESFRRRGCGMNCCTGRSVATWC
jgi:hypothetical protein